MEYYEIIGKNKLYGQIEVENSKNAILPILASTILIDEEVVLKDIPEFSDIKTICEILSQLGKKVVVNKRDLLISGTVTNDTVSQHHCSLLRASIFLLGPLLSKVKSAKLFMPGGCSFSNRPIDYHINGLRRFGAKIKLEDDQITGEAKNLKGGNFTLPFPSVGATENLIMASVLSRGTCKIYNCAKEPEIVDLCNFLNKCGAKIYGAGTKNITVCGVKKLFGCDYTPIPDRIVAGSYILMCASCGGNVEISNIKYTQNLPLLKKLLNCGCSYKLSYDKIYLKSSGVLQNFGCLQTGVYPDFATDLQPLAVCFSLCCNGSSLISDTVYPCRFGYYTELLKMGANIKIDDSVATISKSSLVGTKVYAPDLRAGAGLILAGLNAKGKTEIFNTHFIKRGYENIHEKLKNIGANIILKN